jgi:hypothetical protein
VPACGFDGGNLGLELQGLNASPGKSDGNRVFYTDQARDVDAIIGPTPTGGQLFYQLRSSTSPTEYRFRVNGRRAAQLRKRTGPTGGYEILDHDGRIAGVLHPPHVIDSDGEQVPAEYVVDGTSVRLQVDHAQGDWRYPLLVDPVVDSQIWNLYSTQGVYGWFYASAWANLYSPSTTGSWGNGIYSVMGGSRWYPSGSNGEWRYPLPNGAFAYRVAWGLERQQTNSTSQAVCMTVALANSGGWDPNVLWVTHPAGTTGTGHRTRCHTYSNQVWGGWTDMCTTWGCDAPLSQAPNYPVMSQWAYGDSVRDSWNVSYLGSADVWISDSDNPGISEGPSGEYHSPSATFSMLMADGALGVKRYVIDSPTTPGWNQAEDRTFACSGTNYSRCSNGWDRVTKSIGNLGPGSQTIRMQVWDAGGRSVSKTWSIVNYATSAQYGGDNAKIDTDAEIDAAISGLSDPAIREQKWAGLTSPDRQTLAAADAYVAWGESPATDDPAVETGTWQLSTQLEPEADTYIPPVDVYETIPDDGTANAAWGFLVPVAAGCFRFCDDAARRLFRRGGKPVKRAKRPRPADWRLRRPDEDWVRAAGSRPSEELSKRMVASGQTKPSGWAAHHIVPAGSRYVKKAQTILYRCGVRPNDIENGVFLPITESARDAWNSADRRPRHGPLHTQWYFHNLNEVMSSNYYGASQSSETHERRCERVKSALFEVAQAIKANKFPY